MLEAKFGDDTYLLGTNWAAVALKVGLLAYRPSGYSGTRG